MSYGAEAAAFDEDGLLVEDLGGLKNFAAGAEHDGVGEAVAHEVERHEAVVHVSEGGAGEFQHVHLDTIEAQIIGEGGDELLKVVAVVEGGVNEVGADDADGLLLA